MPETSLKSSRASYLGAGQRLLPKKCAGQHGCTQDRFSVQGGVRASPDAEPLRKGSCSAAATGTSGKGHDRSFHPQIHAWYLGSTYSRCLNLNGEFPACTKSEVHCQSGNDSSRGLGKKRTLKIWKDPYRSKTELIKATVVPQTHERSGKKWVP